MIRNNAYTMEPTSLSTTIKMFLAYFSALVIDNFVAIVDKYAVMMFIGIAAMVMDWAVAFVKCKVTRQELTREKANNGFWKKMGYLSMMVFGVFIDYTLPIIASKSNYNFDHSVPVGAFTIWYVYITEGVSVIKSFKEMDIKVPKVLREIFTKAESDD